MGIVQGVSAQVWPKQGRYINCRVRVIFNYMRPEFGGEIVRDDIEAPYETIIRLDDGRYVRSVECQWSPDRA